MGEIEEKNKKIVRRTKIQETILRVVASGGRVDAVSIQNLILESFLDIDLTPPPRINEVVKTAANRLGNNGLLKFESGHYVITTAGEKLLENWRGDRYQIKRPPKWDRKWRIIIFDIPERRKKIRDEIRIILTNSGFQRLQDSVWVYPYDCENIIGLLKIDYGIGREMLYIIADQIENDKYLRMDFDLFN